MNHRFLQSGGWNRGLALVLVLCVSVSLAAETSPKPFLPGSLAQIVKPRAGQPFVLILWSFDCPPCLKELPVLAEAVRSFPELDLVLVSTDDYRKAEKVRQVLGRHGLGAVESWQFADSNAQRLRYEIDPTWFGELPRSYFYFPGHRRRATSGALSLQHFAVWRDLSASGKGESQGAADQVDQRNRR